MGVICKGLVDWVFGGLRWGGGYALTPRVLLALVAKWKVAARPNPLIPLGGLVSAPTRLAVISNPYISTKKEKNVYDKK